MDSTSPRPQLGLGDLLMGRYRLDAELFSNLPGARRFRATDNILARKTDVHLLDGPRTADAIDAARRAALVDDPRLVRIIDAGTYSGVSFVLTGALEGVSLADVGTLTAAQARAVAGEVATALAAAARAQVRHQALRPELVFLGRGDTVQIGGLAWDAAFRGDAVDGVEEADAADAHALVSVLYAGLTARWPGVTPSVMPEPPSWDGNPVAPIELVSAVPGDLNTLCAVKLAGEGGPETAAGVVEDLGVWPDVRIALRHSVSVRGPIPHAVTPPTPLDESTVELSASPDTETEAETEADGAEPAEDEARPVVAETAPPLVPAGAEPLGPSDADVAALAADEEIQNKLAAIEAILNPLGYDLTPTRRRLGLSESPETDGDGPEAAAPEAVPEREPDPPATAVLPPRQAELLERLRGIAAEPLPDLPQIPDVPDLDLPPLPDDLSDLLGPAALSHLPGDVPEEPGAARAPAAGEDGRSPSGFGETRQSEDEATPEAAPGLDMAKLSALAGLVVSAAQAEEASRLGEPEVSGEDATPAEAVAPPDGGLFAAAEGRSAGGPPRVADSYETTDPGFGTSPEPVDLLADSATPKLAADSEATLILEPLDMDRPGGASASPRTPSAPQNGPRSAPAASVRPATQRGAGGAPPLPGSLFRAVTEAAAAAPAIERPPPLRPGPRFTRTAWPVSTPPRPEPVLPNPRATDPGEGVLATPVERGTDVPDEMTQDLYPMADDLVAPEAEVAKADEWTPPAEPEAVEEPDPEDTEQAVFDVETPSFQRVLDAPAAIPPKYPPRRWLPVIVFAIIVAACVALGIVILHQVGVLGMGVDLSPISPPDVLGATNP